MKSNKGKQAIAAALAAAMALSIVTGCKQSDPVVESTTTSSATTTTATNTETTTIAVTTTYTTLTASKVQDDKTTTAAKTTTTTERVTTTTTNKWDAIFPITPKEDIRVAAQKVNNRLISEKTKIKSDKFIVSDFDATWAFSHQPAFAYFKGKFYAGWSRGYKDEDAPGQQVVVSSSADCKTWSTPKVVGDPADGAFGKNRCQSSQFIVTADKLYYYYTEAEFGPNMFDNKGNFVVGPNHSLLDCVSMMTYTTDGVNWSEPIAMPGNANESPRQSLTGRWFAGAGRVLIQSDDPTKLGWPGYGLTAAQEEDAIRRGALLLTECSWYQTDDYVIHMMLRSNSRYIWMSNSYDNGKTWTDAYPTKFTTDDTMANFGRLPDGRFYFVGSTSTNVRYPLDLYVSEDGVNFNKGYILRDEKYAMQQEGWAKGGQYAYPEVLIQGNYMYIFYSKQKEVMELTRVALSDI